MKHLPVVAKFLAILSVFGLFVIGTIIYATTEMRGVAAGFGRVADTTQAAAYYVTKANQALSSADIDVAWLLIADGAGQKQYEEDRLTQNRRSFDDDLTNAERAFPARTNELEALRQRGDAVLNTACVQTINLGKLMPKPANLISSQNALFISCQRGFIPVIKGMVGESNVIRALANNDETSLNGGVHGTVLNTYALVLVGLIAVLVGSFFAIRSWVVSPIKSLQGVMGRLSDGDLQPRITGTDRKDEIGGMARAVEVFKDAGVEKQRLLAASGVVLYELTLRGNEAIPLTFSPNIRDMLGYTPDEACRVDWWRNHVHPEDLPQASGAIAHVLQTGHFTNRYRLRHRDGSYRWIRSDLTLQHDVDGKPVDIAGVLIDITERQTAEEKIYQLAHLDPLTELPNRRLLNKRIGDTLAEARRTGVHGALLFIDLNQFKEINDMFGHSIGDAAIREVAERLKQMLHATDMAARVGGDEFVVLCTDAGGTPTDAASHAGMVARNVVDALANHPILIGDHEHHLSASIGFTVFPKQGDTLDNLIREADTAMYQAKTNDTNVVMFHPAMHSAIVARHAVEDEIRSALNTDRFELWLQDQVDSSGTPVGAESLIRLRSRDGRMVQPTEFIGIAETSGLIVPLGRWILREACALLACAQRDRPDWRLSVNVSPRQFSHSSFVSDVTAALEHSGVAPDRLTLEITENLLIKDVSEVTKIMRILADRGVRFSVDDFGTGYSSLSYLQQLPIHEIKIDKRFISGVPGDAATAAIVEAILAMSQRLELDVVAEGVETPDQVAFLTARGCSRMQGYYFARPVPVADRPFSPSRTILLSHTS